MERKYGHRLSEPQASAAASSSTTPLSAGLTSREYFNRGGQRGVDGAALAYRGRGNAQRQKGGIIGTVKKVLQQDVLYLMIVPMPSEEELAEARAALAAAKAK